MKKFFLYILLLFCSLYSSAQQGFDPEKILTRQAGVTDLVSDFTNTLTPAQEQALEQKLNMLDDSTSTQIAVVIIPSLNGKDVSEFGTEILRAWGVGNKKNNNGVVLLIAKSDRKLAISTGYGLEGSLTDLTASSIINDVIVPNFKEDDYYRGIDEGTDAIMQVVRGEYNDRRVYGDSGVSFAQIIIFALIILFLLWLFSRGNKGNGTFVSRRGSRGINGPIFWPTPSSGGGWSSGGFGGGGGGFGGGGFGGFGGGSGGGGGASGSW